MLKSLEVGINKVNKFKAFNLCGRRYFREPFQPLKSCPRWVCVEDAVRIINSEQLVFIQGGAATPLELVRALTQHGICSNLRGVRLIHLGLEGDAPFSNPECQCNFRSVSLYIGSNLREAVNDGRGDYIPVFNYQVPSLFNKTYVPDVALIHVSAPDPKGFCSLGTSVDCVRAAVCTAKVIIAQVNEHMPRTFGDAVIHMSHFDWAVKHNCPLPCISGTPLTDIEIQIGKIISHRLVDDGATLQLGIGNIPDAILQELGTHKDLGVHTEIFSDGMVDLVEKGCITNRKKTKHKGRLVSTMALGTKKLYDFLHNNPFISMLSLNYVNDPRVISKQHKMTCINSCIEMDITGQVCSESLGTKFYSGIGGQIDFNTGAALSVDGKAKAIVTFPSVTSKGESKIQPFIKLGAGVTATRAHAHYVVTEHGVAYLHGKTLRQRAYALIEVAHPDHRECLEKAAFDRLKSMPTKYL